ncbi:HAD hydrolase family protein [Corynebacterium sp. p3-SID1241]|uniref:HAD hydrolase family protein n=1 Tax=Corynebacterium sp. p3-SID1241 TaxID=2916102 RepID=UPI0037BFA8F8
MGPAPAASNNRNQGKCLGTKLGALHLTLDGTLCNYKNTVPPSVVEAIRVARANGHVITL